MKGFTHFDALSVELLDSYTWYNDKYMLFEVTGSDGGLYSMLDGSKVADGDYVDIITSGDYIYLKLGTKWEIYHLSIAS